MDNFNISYQSLKKQLKAIYAINADANAIETHLNEVLANLDKNSRREILDELIQGFEQDSTAGPRPPIDAENTTQENMVIGDHLLARVIKLLLGRNVSQEDMNSDKLLESLAESTNTVLEALNQLISTINTTLVGKQDSDQPIRQVIGYHLEEASHGQPLDIYISQIGKAFHESQEASKQAAHAKVEEILNQLSPEKIARDAGASRLSPMKKSKYYDEYVHKFKKIEKWFESGRFMESFLREFERNCQKISI
ncbi:type VI secretion system-associated FHA domain protein [Desulfobacter curvatus]|uniref:type VI secretion system-associated FHA domain protein n=1 Tax=Desulfobacter curvatus TaxID=2290 RepID=UPI0003618118|nr:type VI secretion system-associated FHA domain protein [Desulfobacter curvatus]